MSKNHPFKEIAREPGIAGDSNCVAPIESGRCDTDSLMGLTQNQLRNLESKSLSESTIKVLPATELSDAATAKAKERHIGQQGSVTTVLDGYGCLVSKSVNHKDGRSLTIEYEKGAPVKLTRPDGYAFVKNEKGTWDFTSPKGDILWNARKFTVKLHQSNQDSDPENGSVTYKVNNTSEKKIDADGTYHDLGKATVKKETISDKADVKHSDNKQAIEAKSQNAVSDDIPGGRTVLLTVSPQLELQQKSSQTQDKHAEVKSDEIDKKRENEKSLASDDSHPKESLKSRIKRWTTNISNYCTGKYTAQSIPFDPFKADGVAHRTLPFGTKLRVTHGDKSVDLIVNDRGPYVTNKEGHYTRDLDLSLGAMAKLKGEDPEQLRKELRTQKARKAYAEKFGVLKNAEVAIIPRK
jgi:rare lipoprotein A (peptidoglycan hydrolase)